MKRVLVALLVWALALWPRMRDLDATMVLMDTIGPYLVAAGPSWTPHAPPYGWGLTPPFALALALAGSLRQAVGIVAALQALAAPLASLAVLALRPRAWGAALAAGALVAWDRGLLDTTLSGAEGYFAATWLAAACWGLAARDRPWGPWLAAGAWAFAVMSHPFALATAPLLLGLPRRRATAGALLLAALLLAPRVLAALTGAPPEAEGNPLLAPSAWLRQGGPAAWALLTAPLLGLTHASTRRLSALTLLSLLLMLGLGLQLGYLRDHHLRLLTVPAVLGLAALPGWWGLLPLALLRPPPSWMPQPGHPHRPGTLGLASQLTEVLVAHPGGEIVDGAWVSGTPAAEPAAVLLDLHLRGEALDAGQVAVVLSAERGDWQELSTPGQVLHRGDRHRLLLLTPAQQQAWTPELCAHGARLGGAAEALTALDPDQTATSWDCPPP